MFTNFMKEFIAAMNEEDHYEQEDFWNTWLSQVEVDW